MKSYTADWFIATHEEYVWNFWSIFQETNLHCCPAHPCWFSISWLQLFFNHVARIIGELVLWFIDKLNSFLTKLLSKNIYEGTPLNATIYKYIHSMVRLIAVAAFSVAFDFSQAGERMNIYCEAIAVYAMWRHSFCLEVDSIVLKNNKSSFKLEWSRVFRFDYVQTDSSRFFHVTFLLIFYHEAYQTYFFFCLVHTFEATSRHRYNHLAAMNQPYTIEYASNRTKKKVWFLLSLSLSATDSINATDLNTATHTLLTRRSNVQSITSSYNALQTRNRFASHILPGH